MKNETKEEANHSAVEQRSGKERRRAFLPLQLIEEERRSGEDRRIQEVWEREQNQHDGKEKQ